MIQWNKYCGQDTSYSTGVHVPMTIIYQDNKSAISLAENGHPTQKELDT